MLSPFSAAGLTARDGKATRSFGSPSRRRGVARQLRCCDLAGGHHIDGADTILAQERELVAALRPGPADSEPLLAVVDSGRRVREWRRCETAVIGLVSCPSRWRGTSAS